jgi:branched-chain amino acid transport system ATP-binding protein
LAEIMQVTDLTRTFGNVHALSEVDLTVEEGTIHGIVGPNGAGKTTILSVMSGYLLPTQGRVLLGGRDITRLTPQQRVPLGVVRTFQNIRLFGGLTVLENVMVGQHAHARTGLTSLLPVRTAADKTLLAEAKASLELFGLREYVSRRVSELPYGLQKQLEMARAMATKPRVLLLDEPAAGMTSEARVDLTEHIRQVRKEGVTVVVVEHDMDVIARACDTVTVLNFGRKIMEGRPGDVLSSPEVRTAYLGT